VERSCRETGRLYEKAIVKVGSRQKAWGARWGEQGPKNTQPRSYQGGRLDENDAKNGKG